jgi:hypothetical protein
MRDAAPESGTSADLFRSTGRIVTVSSGHDRGLERRVFE